MVDALVGEEESEPDEDEIDDYLDNLELDDEDGEEDEDFNDDL